VPTKVRPIRWALVAATLLRSAPSFADDFTTSDRYGGHVSDGFVFNNNRWGQPIDNGSLTIKTSSTLFSYWTTHSANNMCCSAPYVGIGTIGGSGPDWTSAQFGLPGSHLPIQLANLEALKATWRFKVPVPTSKTDQYHVYYEIFFCDNTKGIRGKGNIALGLWDNEFYHQSYTGEKFGTREDVGGYPMDVKFEGASNGQGDFWVVESPLGAHVPDANGVIEVTAFDIKKVIDWGISKGNYNPQLYLTELNLAFEVMTLPGKTLTTEHASFCVKAKGADVVYTPTWTASEWGPGCSVGMGEPPEAGLSEPGGEDASPPPMSLAEAGVTSGSGGAGGSPNMSTHDAAAAADVAPTSAAGETSGCGCRVSAAPSWGGRWLALLAGLMIVRRRSKRPDGTGRRKEGKDQKESKPSLLRSFPFNLLFEIARR
jgi:hypothetical protein